MADPNLAPDVAVGVSLIDRLEVVSWPRGLESLSHAQPFLYDADLEFFQDLEAWLATRAGDQPSYIQAAVQNVRRVLHDLLLAFTYELTIRDDSQWVRKWYHPGQGGSGSAHEAEFYGIHVLLIRNLVAELARATNLVLSRCRAADDTVLTDPGLSLIDTGGDDWRPTQYTQVEQELPQPYPGLRGFPAALPNRDIHALGEVYEGKPRTPTDFEDWIDELDDRVPGEPSDPPNDADPPQHLPKPPPAPAAPPPPALATPPPRPTDKVLGTVAAVAGLVLDFAGAPLPIAVGVGAGGLAALILSLVAKRLRWQVLAITGVIVCAVAAIAVLAIDRPAEKPKPIADQVAAIAADAQRDKQYVAASRELRLHEGSDGSRVYILRDQSERRGGIRLELQLSPSDELRIYDEIRGKLISRFRFKTQNPGEVTQGPDGDAPGYRARLVKAADFDRDGTTELLVSLDRISNASGPLPVPALIEWDHEARRYRLLPLLTAPPDLKLAKGSESASLDGYRDPSLLQDQFSDREFKAYPADVIDIRQAPSGPVVLAGYAEMSAIGFTGRYEAKGWTLDLAGAGPQLRECTPESHVFVKAPNPGEVADALARKLIDVSGDRGCGQP